MSEGVRHRLTVLETIRPGDIVVMETLMKTPVISPGLTPASSTPPARTPPAVGAPPQSMLPQGPTTGQLTALNNPQIRPSVLDYIN